MKKQRANSVLINIVLLMSLLQIVYFIVYSFLTRNEDNGILSLFMLILATEFFMLLVYTYITFSRLIDSVIKGIYYIKNVDDRQMLGITLSDVDAAITEVINYYEEEKRRERKKMDLIMTCIENPIASELLKNGIPTVLDITEADACAYYYADNGTGKLELMESYGFSDELYKTMDMNIGEGLEGKCCKICRTCIFSEDEKDNKYASASSYSKEAFKNVMAVPVLGNDGCVGVMTLAYKKTIQKNNIKLAEDLARIFSPIHYSNLRYEAYKRQLNELELQSNLINDMNEELNKKKKELQELKNNTETED